MKKQRTWKRKTIAKLIALGALTALLVTLLLLKNNQKVCEFFATTFSRAWIFFFGHVFGWLPFSVYEFCLVIAILAAITFVVFVIIFLAKRRWKTLTSLVLAVAIVVVSFTSVYTASASFAYNRDPLPEQVYVEHVSDDFSFDDALALATAMVDKLNYAYEHTEHDAEGNIVYPFSFSELSDILAEEYKRLDDGYFSSYTPRAKKITNKWIMSQMRLTGVFFAPFGEANVNGNENNLYLPFTMAHEMAHGKGVMREYEADLVAMYVTVISENPYVSYGALAKLTNSALNLLRKYPDSKQAVEDLRGKINDGVSKEKWNYSDFWSQFTLLDDIGEFFNDLYLKLQKQEGGTQSYVKPGETTGVKDNLGEPVKDNFGVPVQVIIRFSGEENLLINLYKQNALQNSDAEN